MRKILLLIWFTFVTVYGNAYMNNKLDTRLCIGAFAGLLLITFIAAAMEHKRKEQ